MEYKKSSLPDRIKNYLCDFILGFLIPLGIKVILCIMFWGMGITVCMIDSRAVHIDQLTIIACGKSVYVIPDWLQMGLKFYLFRGGVIMVIYFIRWFIDKRTITSKINSSVTFYYFLINLVLVLIIQQLNNWPVFN